MGDFNFKDLDWAGEMTAGGRWMDSKAEYFQNHAYDLFLTQHVKEPTRGKNVLDLIFSSEPEMIEDMTVLAPIANSDHNVLHWHIVCNTVRELRIGVQFNYNQGNYREMRKEMVNIKWDEEFREKMVDEMWNIFRRLFLECRDRHVKKINNRRSAKRNR